MDSQFVSLPNSENSRWGSDSERHKEETGAEGAQGRESWDLSYPSEGHEVPRLRGPASHRDMCRSNSLGAIPSKETISVRDV